MENMNDLCSALKLQPGTTWLGCGWMPGKYETLERTNVTLKLVQSKYGTALHGKTKCGSVRVKYTEHKIVLLAEKGRRKMQKADGEESAGERLRDSIFLWIQYLSFLSYTLHCLHQVYIF